MQDSTPHLEAEDEGLKVTSRIGFGLDRVGLLALAWPRIAVAIFVVLGALAFVGIQRIDFDSDLRGFFRSDSPTFRAYVEATTNFVDPENQQLILVEGDIGTPANFARLRDLQLELQLVDGVGDVYSPFALRSPGEGTGTPPPLIDDAENGLTPELAARIRAHPLLGDRLLASDFRSILYVVTPSAAKLGNRGQKALAEDVTETATAALDGSGLKVTVTGYAHMRGSVLDVMEHDQALLNRAGSLIGIVLSFIVFRSVAAAIITAVPAIIAGFIVVGMMGLLGVKITVLSIVVPVLVMILGYTDGMHISYDFRREREAGRSIFEAEKRALMECGPACMLSAITTSAAFLSLAISDLQLLQNFGFTGAFAIIAGCFIVLPGHAVATLLLGRFWKVTGEQRGSLLSYLSAPCGALARFATRHAWPISIATVVATAILTFVFTIIPPEHSIREHLPVNNPDNIALNRIDAAHTGAFSVTILVPVTGSSLTDPRSLDEVGRVHKAVAPFGAGRPLSMWSIVEWLGGGADEVTSRRIGGMLGSLPEEQRARMLGNGKTAPIILYIKDRPTHEMLVLIDQLEAAVSATGVPGAVVTGPTVLNARESTRSINQLALNIVFDVFFGISLIAIAFRDIKSGIIALLPNTLPILATAAVLFVMGRGMQFTSVVALAIAFGVAVDHTVHYLSRHRILGRGRGPEVTAPVIGPVMIGTTLIIVTGLATTLVSGLPTIALFGTLVAATLLSAIVSELLILPALMAGPGRKWFQK